MKGSADSQPSPKEAILERKPQEKPNLSKKYSESIVREEYSSSLSPNIDESNIRKTAVKDSQPFTTEEKNVTNY